MAENCTNKSLHTQDQVVGTSDHSYDEKPALEDESRTSGSHFTDQKPTDLELRSKVIIILSTTDNKLMQ